MNKAHQTDMIAAIANARVFDGERVIDDQTVVIIGAHIHSGVGVVPIGATIIDGHGTTLLISSPIQL